MTSLWLISFNLAVCSALASTVSGSVDLKESKDAKVVKNKDKGGVVIWLTPTADSAVDPITQAKARILQKNKRFEPHVLAIQAGTTVDFPNLDPIFHNAFSNFDGKVFDIGLYPPGQSRSVRFDRPGVARLFCNIHATMSAVVVVVATPYFATTKADGTWEIKDVPPGQYKLDVYHERTAPNLLKSLSRMIQVTSGDLKLPELPVSERGFIPTPHQNKYGADYPPTSSNPIYPGVNQ